MRRKLTAEEHRLWAGAMRSVRPLQPGSRRASVGADAAVAEEGRVVAPPDHLREASRPGRAGPAPTPKLAPLPRRERQRLARGRSAIEARLDLHGMTQAQAHAALLRFVQNAQAQDARFVLVITGTGARGSAGERGVLRRQVPLWFELPEFRRYVVGFESAHIGHGGEGALYVRIRRGKSVRDC
ncbi:MAG: Smr/MutS family protein [Xanthobacteraceae bacterium]